MMHAQGSLLKRLPHALDLRIRRATLPSSHFLRSSNLFRFLNLYVLLIPPMLARIAPL